MRLHAQGPQLPARSQTRSPPMASLLHYFTVARRVTLGLESTVLPGIDEAKKIELARLDELIAAFGPKAAAGDPKSADIVLKSVSQRSRIQGLESSKQTDAKPQAGPQPAIVGIMQRQKLRTVGNP